MAFLLDIGGDETKVTDPSEDLLRSCIEKIWDEDRDSFLILEDTDKGSFIQCAADYEETEFFHVEFSAAREKHYRCDGLVEPDEVKQLFLDFRAGKDPDLDDTWLDVTEEIFGPDMSEWD